MSWVTIIWSMVASACLTLAAVHGLVWSRQRDKWANLLFSIMATGTAVYTLFELWTITSETPAGFARGLWWAHLPFWVVMLSLVGFVRVYMRAGRIWLAWAVVILRTVPVVLNFFFSPVVNFREITAVRRMPFLGEFISMPDGVPNPWMLFGQLGSFLLVVFVADATLTVWRRGNRQQAVTLGAVILFFVFVALAVPILVFWDVIHAPLTVSLFYLGIVAAMGYELSSDVIRAEQLESELKTTGAGLAESREQLILSTTAANVGIWTRSVGAKTILASDKWHELFEFSPSQTIRYEDYLNRIHPEDREHVRDALNIAESGGGEYETEYRVVLASGDIRWIGSHGKIDFVDGKATMLRGASVDITKRKLVEEELRGALTEVEALKDKIQLENVYLKSEIDLENNFHEIIGQSDELKYTLYKVEQVAPTDATVLILGETGTGKELIARAIHKASPRSDRPLIKINCATLAANLIESELFGHERGAFTGANATKVGRFEVADGATLFLDEIGELPLDLQPKLLRVLQEGEFERLGSNKTVKVDVRIIAATNRNLKAEVQKGSFREDLWYRLSVFPITVPPLRQRPGDVRVLLDHLVDKFNRKLGRNVTNISPAVLETLQAYWWPGNVRELANVIERAVISSSGSSLRLADKLSDHGSVVKTEEITNSSMLDVERDHILQVLRSTSWKIEGEQGAARKLGLAASTLRSRMAKLNIQRQLDSAA